jgi:uncharacterized cupin superfamily protein
MKSSEIKLFSKDDVEPEEYFLPASKLISGNPLQKIWQHYRDESGKFFAGVWQSEPGKWRISYTEEEFCQITKGVSVICDKTGAAIKLATGDSFVIPAGFVGTWEVLETTRKYYVIYEPGDARREQG